MALPDFCIAPHEIGDLAPDEPRCAPAEARVQVTRGAHAGRYLVRRLQGVNDWSSVVARLESRHAPLLLVDHSEVLKLPEIEKSLERGSVNRLLYFDASYSLATSGENWAFWLGIYNSERGAANWVTRAGSFVNIRRVNEGARGRCAVNWGVGTPDETIERDIQELLADENSYFAFANRWALIPNREKGRSLMRFARGDVDEFRGWLHALVWSLGECDPTVNWILTLKIGILLDSDEAGYCAEIARASELRSCRGKHRFSACQLKALETIARHFHPHRNLELEELLKLHEIWDGGKRPRALQFGVPVVSAHQRLEARLQLRAFLRDKLTSTELRELLG